MEPLPGPAGAAATDYRPDIDGLRAIAVLAVVVFHAQPERLPGGFVGVDVFFVISGFLITRLLLERLRRERFSLWDFYQRRARRILPALGVVLTATWAAGYALMFADEFARLGRHMVAGVAFVSNAVLYAEAGYFDTASSSKPLLHLWSLAIEEQYYLLWPALLWAATRARWSRPWLLATLCLLSFAAALWTQPRDASLAFYAPWTRCWELFAGAWLASVPAVAGLAGVRAAVLSMVGALALAAAIILFSSFLPHPGWSTLLPVVGAALLIAAGPAAPANRLLLARWGLPRIGLVSYPLYLWHWPLLTFLRLLSHRPPTAGEAACVVALAVLLAELTWRLVETPVRHARTRRPLGVVATTMVLLLALGAATHGSHGMLRRPIARSNAANTLELQWNSRGTADCRAGFHLLVDFCWRSPGQAPVRVLVVGDSTANALAPGLGEVLAPYGAGVLNLGTSACPPIRGLLPEPAWKVGPHCAEVVAEAYRRALASPDIEVVVLSWLAKDLDIWGIPGAADQHALDRRHALLAPLIARDIDALVAAGKTVVVSYDMPYLQFDPRNCLPRPGAAWFGPGFDACAPPASELLGRAPHLDLFDADFAARGEVCVLRLSEMLVPDGYLRLFDARGVLLMRDDHHLGMNGSRRAGQHLLARCAAHWRPVP